MTPIAITGFGVASAPGIGNEGFHAALEQQAEGPAPFTPLEKLQSFDGAAHPNARALEVADFDPTKLLGDKGLRSLDRMTKLLVVAARICLHDAGIKKDGAWAGSAANKVGLLCSNAYGSLESITELDRVALLEDARYINPAKFPNTVSNSAAGYVSIWEELRAINVSISNGQTGALDALGLAELHLGARRADVLVSGGGESMSEALWLAWEKLRAPKDARLGEAAAFHTLEREAHAKARGAKVLGRVIGYGTHFDAAADADRGAGLFVDTGDSLAIAIDRALADAEIARDRIELVVSGLSGLAPFDAAERRAIETSIGSAAPICAPKRVFGETLGASGSIALGAALHAIAGKKTRLASGAWLARAPTAVLVTSLGYYGNASAAVVTL